MALTVEQGTFTKTTSTTTPVSQQVNLNNSSLVPKAVILWTNGSTSTNGTYSENIQWSYGFSDGTNHISQNMTALDNVTTQNEAYSWNTNAVISIASTAATPVLVSRATISAFGTGSFTLSWGTQSDTNAMVIHYIVIGGSDITNVSAFSTTYGSIATGNRSFNGTGTTFTPDFCLTMSGCPNVTTANSLSVGGDNAQLCIGAARTTSQRFALAGRTETIGTSDTSMTFSNNSCVMSLDTANGSPVGNADFVSFDNAAGGGITLNVTVAPWATGNFLGFLMFKGGAWETGTFQQRSGTGTQDVNFSNTGLNPEIVFLGGINSATANASVVNNYICLGASDGTRESFAWAGDQDAQANMINTRTNSITKVYRQGAPAATAASSTTAAECDMNDMTTAGKFQLSWTTADSTLRQLAFWTVGTAAQSVNKTISDSMTLTHTTDAVRMLIQLRSDSFTLSESIPRIRGLNQTSSDSFTLNDSENIFRGLIHTIADSISLTDNNSRLRLLLQTISESLAISHDNTMKIENKVRLISESLGIVESIIKLGNKSRSVSESLGLAAAKQQVKGKSKSIDESIIFSESIPRLIDRLKSISESLTLAHTTERRRLLLQAISDSLSLSSTLSQVRNKLRSVSEGLVLSESISRLQSVLKDFSETLTQSHTTAALRNKLKSFSNSLTLSESISRDQLAFVRTISDALGLSDAAARLKNLNRELSSQSLSISDSISQSLDKVKIFSDILTLTSVTNTLSNRLRSFSNSITLSESILGLRGLIQTVSDSLGISDSFARLRELSKSLSQSITLTEQILSLRNKMRGLQESIVFSSTLEKLTSRLRGFTNNINLVEDIQKMLASGKTISDSLSFSGQHLRTTSRMRQIAQSLLLEEQIVRLTSRLKVIANSLTFIDSIEGLKIKLRGFSESLVLDSAAAKSITARVRLISDSLSLNHSNVRLRDKLRSITSQSLTLTSSVMNYRELIQIITDLVSLSDNIVRSRGKRTIISENITLAAPVTRIKNKLKSVSDSIGLTENIIKSRDGMTKSISHVLTLSHQFLHTTRSAIKNWSFTVRRYQVWKTGKYFSH